MMKFLLSTALILVASSISAAPTPSSLPARQFAFSSLPKQAVGTAWPTAQWERAAPDKAVDTVQLNALADSLMKPTDPLLGSTNGLLIVHRGKIVFERYAQDYTCDQIEFTMSVAKMMGAAMAGVMVRDGRVALDQPLGLGHWPQTDTRSNITLRNTLQMATGLGWEDEGDGDLTEFAFGKGYKDLVGYVAQQPLRHDPGQYFQYSDSTPSLIGALALKHIGPTRTDVANWVKKEILSPTGMTKTELEFDKKGAWYGSSGVRWSACDLARFGQLLLRDGQWDGAQILPTGWVDQMRTPSESTLNKELPKATPQEAALYYGMHTFVWDLLPSTVANPPQGKIPVDAFGHYGWGGHALRVVPSRDVVFIAFGVGADHETGFIRRADTAKKMTDLFPQVQQ